jgi:hypothetical protein
LQAYSVSQRDYVLSVRVRLQVFDSAKVDDDRTVDAKKHLRVKRLLECGHCHMEKVTHSPNVKLHIIPRTFYPIHVLDIYEHSLAS